MIEWLHPMRTSRYLFSEEFNPWMRAIAALAPMVERGRTPLPSTDPFRAAEREASERISKMIQQAREHRDAMEEEAFALAYGSVAGRPADPVENH